MDDNKDFLEDDELQENDEPQNNDIESNEESVNDNQADIENLNQKVKEEKERYIRLYAEFENYKKRTIREKNDFFKYANQDLMISLLGVVDDFERAIKEMSKRGNEDDLKGVELIYQKFKSKLEEKGLSKMEINVGDKFDVDQHEAITQIPAPSDDLKGKIVDVVETGYLLHDKVIRFAKVVVGA